MDDLTKEFLQESSENLDRLDQDFVKLESDPGNPELVKSIFRTIHTIKGTCGFLGFTQLESVAHVGENLLSRLRDGEIALTPEITTALLQMVDAIRQMLQSIDSSGNEGERNDEALLQTLTSLQQVAAKPAAERKEAPGIPAAGQEERQPTPAEGEVTQAEATEPKPQTQAVGSSEGRRDGAEIPGKSGDSAPQKVLDAAQGQQAIRGSAADGAIRVDVGLLDKLMNLVGELVLARNQILQY
jgi:two-component system, chemotaxis family, sensor kinase CheA